MSQVAAVAPKVAVVGGGIIGLCAAWRLLQQGHQVTLIDAADAEGGSTAALGLLMAQVFHRASGRAWRLRQRSLELWSTWVPQLQAAGHALELKRGLLLLASSPEELNRQQNLCAARQAMGLPLRLCALDELRAQQPELPQTALGGLWSAADGQLDPLPVLQALQLEAQALGARWRHDRVIGLVQGASGKGWRLQLASGDQLSADAVVLCAAAGTNALLAALGRSSTPPFAMEPVLGQALEVEATAPVPAWSWQGGWPAAVVWQGINLVPRPQGRLWIGATLEPGSCASRPALSQLAALNGHAPAWLQNATVVRQWQGLRLRPQGRPAPWLEHLAPGLLLASGHYRNGVLLAPATAEWIASQLTPC